VALRLGASACYVPQPVIEIRVNGEPRRIGEAATVQSLLIELGLQASHVAVERNREIVPRDRRASTVLLEGDILEIVTFVGGG
jgi:sulfur carrier protein